MLEPVVLVEPPLVKHRWFDLYSNKAQPLGLWAVASHLRGLGIGTRVVDAGVAEVGWPMDGGSERVTTTSVRALRAAEVERWGQMSCGEKVVEELALDEPNQRMWVGMDVGRVLDLVGSWEPRLVGISCMATMYRKSVLLLAAALKRELGEIVVVVGGQDATSAPEALLKSSAGAIDYVVRGEGQEPLAEFIEGGMTHEAAAAAGFAFRAEDGTIAPGRLRTFEAWGREIPFDPSVEIVGDYPEQPGHAWSCKGKWTDILFSKGCSFNCKFCYSGRLPLRTLPIEVVREQLVRLKDAGFCHLIVQDDSFGQPIHGSREYWFQVMRMMSAYGFTWQNNNGFTWEFVDRDLVERIRQSGCEAAFMPVNFRGFGLPKITERRRRRIEEVYSFFQDAGLMVHGGGIFGVPALDAPDSTLELAWEFIDLQQQLVEAGLVDAVVVYALSAFPGTEWRMGIDQGFLGGKDFRRVRIHGEADDYVGFSTHCPSVVVDGAMSYAELCELVWDAQVTVNGEEMAKEWFIEGGWVKKPTSQKRSGRQRWGAEPPYGGRPSWLEERSLSTGLG